VEVETMSYFDHFAHSPGTPIGNCIKRRSRQRVFIIIEALLHDPECAILEIGPGWGELAECFRNAAYHNYTVVEPNRMMRNHLASKGFVTKNYLIPDLAEADNSYDVIILVDVFEHLNDTHEAKVFIAEARRVLRPDGILCILSPDYLHWKEDFFNSDFSHSNATSVRRTLQLFHTNGFRALTYVYFSGFLTGMLATLVSHLVRLGFFFLSGNAIDSKLYKLKLAFLRQFLIIGVNQGT
jgi:cyclopropane fatty-acyl-phospholipid synthase-like methyltransferase